MMQFLSSNGTQLNDSLFQRDELEGFCVPFENVVKALNCYKNEVEEFQQRMLDDIVLLRFHCAGGSKQSYQSSVNGVISRKFPNSVITQWTASDSEGYVYGWPQSVTLIVVHPKKETSDELWLVDVQSLTDKTTLSIFLRLIEFYKLQTHCSKYRAAKITSYITNDARLMAETVHVEILLT